MAEQRWAVVLGASSGIGAALARALARDSGYHIFGVHRGSWPQAAAAVQADVEAAGRRCVFWEADAGKPEAAPAGAQALQAVLAAAIAEGAGADEAGDGPGAPGPVGVLVHSLASASVGSLVTGDQPLAPRQIQSTFDRMAHSFVYWTQALLAANLLTADARILGMHNIMTRVVVRQTGLIAASKAALEQYCKHLAFELGPGGRRVNLLRFSFAPTAAAEVTFGPENLARLAEVMRQGTPAGRLCTLEEVAAFARVVLGPEGAWFNGADIDFTGAESQSFFDGLVYPRG